MILQLTVHLLDLLQELPHLRFYVIQVIADLFYIMLTDLIDLLSVSTLFGIPAWNSRVLKFSFHILFLVFFIDDLFLYSLSWTKIEKKTKLLVSPKELLVSIITIHSSMRVDLGIRMLFPLFRDG